MPTYTMRNELGDLMEIERPMSQAPAVGQWVKLNGTRWRRVADDTNGFVRGERHFASRSLPRWYQHHKGKFDERGKPLFDTMHRVEETCKRASGEEPHNTLSYE